MKQYLIILSVLLFAMYYVDLAHAITPNIKANGSSKAIHINSDDNLRITIGMSLDNSYPNADWWIVYENNDKLFSYVLQKGWISGFLPCIQHNLFEFNNILVFENSLEPGNYNFYFGIDTNPNKYLDNPIYYDYINVIVYELKNSILDYKSGSLNTNVVSDARKCGEGINRYTRTFDFTREGNQVTFYGKDYNFDSFILQGEIFGNKVNISGSYNEDGGETKMKGVVTVYGYSFEGFLNWTWQSGYLSCSGTDQISGVME